MVVDFYGKLPRWVSRGESSYILVSKVLFHVHMTQPDKNQDQSPLVNRCWTLIKGVDRAGPMV
jgi:hypothetical protein